MPIYAYKCESCGYAKDILQKMSDTPLSVCPQCNASSFKKQLTAAGFQLKGSGWYVTDFRNGNNAATAAKSAEAPAVESSSAAEKTADSGTASATTPAAAASAPPAVPTVASSNSKSTSGDAPSKSS